MMKFGPTFIWNIINLIFLYWILKRVLFKPVTEFLENRVNSIKDSFNNIDKQKVEIQTLKQKYDDQLISIKNESNKILAEARTRANFEANEILVDTRKKVERIFEDAKAEIERERVQMVKEIKSQVVNLTILAASKIIEANMDSKTNETLINSFLDKEGVA